MTLQQLIAEVLTLLGTSADNDRLTTAVLTDFLNDDFIALAEEVECFLRRILLATHASAAATGQVAINGVPSPGSTVTVNGVVYTFKSPVAVANDVLIDPVTVANNAVNLANAINASGAATTFGPGTVANPYLSAVASVTSSWVTLTAIVPGTLGNAFTLSTNNVGTIVITGIAGGVDPEYSYPDDLVTLKSVRYGIFPPLEATTPALLDLQDPDWQTAAPGTPRKYYRFGSNKIGFSPPTDGTMPVLLIGVTVPCDQTESANGVPILVNSSDVPAIPWRYHKALAYGTVCRLVASSLFDIENGETLAKYCAGMRADLIARFIATMTHQGEDAL